MWDKAEILRFAQDDNASYRVRVRSSLVLWIAEYAARANWSTTIGGDDDSDSGVCAASVAFEWPRDDDRGGVCAAEVSAA